MYKIVDELSHKTMIERSKFLSFIYNCESTEKQSQLLKTIKSLHPSASHVCFASAIFDGNEILYHSSDDGEPSGTAGLQILSGLKENEMVDCLCVVVRYFGGIKLGVPGLSRAYKNSAQKVIEKNRKLCEKKSLYEINCTYEQYNILSNIFSKKNINPDSTQFSDNISITVALTKDEYSEILKINCSIKKLTKEEFFC